MRSPAGSVASIERQKPGHDRPVQSIMLGRPIYDRIHDPEFRPFTLVLASGEKIEVRHRDSLTLPSLEFRGRVIFGSFVHVLETKGEEVVERTLSLPMIAQIVDSFAFGGNN